MGLSLRDLAERSGVSAPMLSQVERGETSPTLAVAEKIAAGLELTLSQLLRLDEGQHVAVSRAGARRAFERGGHRFEELTPPLPGQRADVSLHTLEPGAATGGREDPPMHEPGSRETAVVLDGTLALVVDGHPPRAARGRQRHLRRRPAAPFRERWRGADRLPRRDRRRPQARLGGVRCQRTCSTRSGRRTRSPSDLIYIDLHLVHEVTSPQAFDGLRLAGRPVRRADKTLATADHNVPTDGTMAARLIADQLSRVQVETLERNCEEFGIPIYSLGSERQGIVHVIGPELGVTQPGMTIVCGDSHTSTHGAFGALAFGIGTSEVEHVLATQCLVQKRPKTMRISYSGELGAGVTPKDLILATIGRLGTGGMVGHAVEYAGTGDRGAGDAGPDDDLQHDDRGRRPRGHDRPRRDHLRVGARPLRRSRGFRRRGRALAPAADRRGRELRHRGRGRRRRISPMVTWGTTPGMVVEVTDAVPDPAAMDSPADRESAERALAYMGLEAGTPMTEVAPERVFIGSCTNSRIEDLREAAAIVDGRKVAGSVRAMVVPGSQQVKATAEAEGLHDVFRSAGFEWREAGCSMCLGMNPDILMEGERCASTSNRNFEGRQGKGGRTHLVSPKMAAAAAIEGHFVDIRDWS